MPMGMPKIPHTKIQQGRILDTNRSSDWPIRRLHAATREEFPVNPHMFATILDDRLSLELLPHRQGLSAVRQREFVGTSIRVFRAR